MPTEWFAVLSFSNLFRRQGQFYQPQSCCNRAEFPDGVTHLMDTDLITHLESDALIAL